MKITRKLCLVMALGVTACEGSYADQINVYQAKGRVAALLKDPDAAKFEDVHAIGSCVSGRINAKNSFGAYIGFQEFYYNAKTREAQISPGEIEDLNPVTLDTKHNDGVLAYSAFVSRCTSDAVHSTP